MYRRNYLLYKTFKGKDINEVQQKIKQYYKNRDVVICSQNWERSFPIIGRRQLVVVTREVIKPCKLNNTKLRFKQFGLTNSLSPNGAMEITLKNLEQTLNSFLNRFSRESSLPGKEFFNNNEEIACDFLFNRLPESIKESIISDLRAKMNGGLIPKEHILASTRNILKKIIGEPSPISVEPGSRKVVMLVGPTGVGKTTTIAKLSLQFRIKRNLRVGLISTDIYRIAGSSQLEQIAKALQLPMYTATSPEDLPRILKSIKNENLILIDTLGSGQNDAKKISQIKEFVKLASPDEIHLVISLTSSESVALDVAQKFSELNYNKIIFTKADEALRFDILLSVLYRISKSISYITNGQSPDSIEEAQPEMIIDTVLQNQ